MTKIVDHKHDARTVGHFVRKTLLENDAWKNANLDITGSKRISFFVINTIK